MSVDVGRFLPPDDEPDDEVEFIIGLPAIAYPAKPRASRRPRQFLPFQAIRLDALTTHGHRITVTGVLQRNGDVRAAAHHGDVILRKLHTHDHHRNPPPLSAEVPGPHIHFPSIKFPLGDSGSSWAYPTEACPVDATGGVQALCDEVEIDVTSIQGQLLRPA